MTATQPTKPTKPSGGPRITHLVLTVRDIEASHRFYTDIIGFEQCAALEGELAESEMRFYRSGDNHHDFALVQVKHPEDVADAGRWLGFFPDTAVGINHFAIGYPSREAGWLSWSTCRPTAWSSRSAATTA
jgi:catechol 2,3-dioxygenase